MSTYFRPLPVIIPYLNAGRPAPIKRAGLSRSNAIYAFVGFGDKIIDIRHGEAVPLPEYVKSNDKKLLRLDIDFSKCYVSDLDTYDLVQMLVTNHHSAKISRAARIYWSSVLPLTNFSIGSISRPEVIIAHDIEPDKIYALN